MNIYANEGRKTDRALHKLIVLTRFLYSPICLNNLSQINLIFMICKAQSVWCPSFWLIIINSQENIIFHFLVHFKNDFKFFLYLLFFLGLWSWKSLEILVLILIFLTLEGHFLSALCFWLDSHFNTQLLFKIQIKSNY